MQSSIDSDKHYFGQGFWKKIDPQKHFSYLVKDHNITTYIMKSSDFAKKYKYKYDYIHLDGDHSYNGAWRDLRIFWPRLIKGGFLCFHDIDFSKILEGVSYEFGKIWNDLRSMPYKFELSRIRNYPKAR